MSSGRAWPELSAEKKYPGGVVSAALGMHQDHRSTLEDPSNSTSVRSELGDGLRVPVAHFEPPVLHDPAARWDRLVRSAVRR
jgi:hypothetical protein